MSLHFSNERTSYRFDRTMHLSTVVVLNPRFLGGGQLPAELVDSSSSLTARHHPTKNNNVTLIFDKTFFPTNVHVYGQIAILTGNCPMTGCYQQPWDKDGEGDKDRQGDKGTRIDRGTGWRGG